MGISLDQYRICIGSFHSGCKCSVITKFSTVYAMLLLLLSTATYLLLLIFIMDSLLLTFGDIESNPGPQHDDTSFSDISICHINIRSLKYRLDETLVKMELIRYEFACNFDIITVSETWLTNNDDINEFLIEGFQRPFTLNRNGRGGGILCWVANNIAAKRRSEFEINGFEALWLEIRSFNKKFLLCTAYRPPNDNLDFWTNLQASFDNIHEQTIPHIMLIGDLNSDPNTVSGKNYMIFHFLIH